ncbi:MAG: hypothetical protein [Wendovervirus sonii]|uniref:DUF1566 domain-containing protein n=1 Tax=phage Lak_Megaphage_Sonny TaxID=3109229 RepID=A0ABZ0Z5T1_9CAUD|nr:MAG: hypothetical protein [phage Lak_Megaphage_Sonny]
MFNIMKNLYKKLYEAINTGIQKVLVLNDEDDVSINYQHKKIVNNTNLMPYYVDELLNDTDNEYSYEQIIKYYEETGYTYKVKNFNELKIIFDKIKDIENVSFEWISNMKDYISIILDDSSEINFYEETDKTSLFLKLANDDILDTENEILIYLHENHYIPEKEYQWQIKRVQIQPDDYFIDIKKYSTEKIVDLVEKDYSGYETCLRIQDIVQSNPKKYKEIPAIDYCLNQKVNDYQGYLPSMGQLRILSDNIDMINYIFKYLNLKEIKDLNNGWWWSSTEGNYICTWILYYGNTNYIGNKGYDLRVFPLFTIKKN